MISQEREQLVSPEDMCVPTILDAADEPRLRFAWMELTGSCQERCVHCYADSSPQGTHGEMSEENWKSAIGQASGLGMEMVQFIGGEPTLHPSFPRLVDFALQKEVAVEVFSNLSHITPRMWEVFEQPGVVRSDAGGLREGCGPTDGCKPDVTCFPDAGIGEYTQTGTSQRCDPHPPGCSPDNFPPLRDSLPLPTE